MRKLLSPSKSLHLFALAALLMSLTGVIVTPSIVTADSEVGGTISENTTWTENSPYVITANIEEVALAKIVGETREVNSAVLSGVTVTLYQNDEVIASNVSDDDGNYELVVPALGSYNVTASKDGFRNKTRTISVTNSTTYTLAFVAAYGLIRNAPNMSYVLACINLWKVGTPPYQLDMSAVLAVINAWKIPIYIEYDLNISSITGGNVTTPGEGIFTYWAGTVVSLNATPDTGYQFVNWTGDVGTIVDVNAAATNITMSGNYSVTANFALEIWDWNDLDTIRNNLGGRYILMNDLDSTTAGYTELVSPTANEGQGWEPIGTNEAFTGTFDGGGHQIRDLCIYRPAEFVGLFGYLANGGVLEDISMLNITVTGYQYAGGLVGHNEHSIVNNCSAIGNVTGDSFVGGLVGENYGTVTSCYFMGNVTGSYYVGSLVGYSEFGIVSNCYAAGDVTGSGRVGGLVGEIDHNTISNSYAITDVTGSWDVGGLVGDNDFNGLVSNCYATGNVDGGSYGSDVGGLVGENYYSTVSNSYATGSVSGAEYVGGLAGISSSVGAVNNSYATGSVDGYQYVGGLMGSNSWSTVSNSYAIGNVTGDLNVGGLIGLNNYGMAINSFWDTESSGQITSAGGTGKNTMEMQDITTFSGAVWNITAVANPSTRDLSYIWNIVDDETYPFLSWEPVV